MFDNLVVEAATTTVEQAVFRIAIAFLLGMVTALLYRLTSDGPGSSRSFMNTLVMLSMITAMVMMVIGNSVARAFGLVGALSIIRFRTAVKDTRDTAFVFLALAAGMAAGTTQTTVAVASFAGVSAFAFLHHHIRLGNQVGNVVIITFTAAPDEVSHEAAMHVLKKHGRTVALAGLHTQRQGLVVEVSYLLELQRGTDARRLVADIAALSGIERVAVSPGDRVAEP